MPTSPYLHFGSPSQRAPALALRLLIANPTAATAVPATPQAALEEAPALAEADAVARRCPTALSWRLICLTKSNIHWNKQSRFRFFDQWDVDVSSQFSCISGMNWWINGHHHTSLSWALGATKAMQLPAERAKAAADALGCSAGTGPPFCWHWLRSISIDYYAYLLVVSLLISKLKSIYSILTKFIGIPVCCDHQKSQPEVKPCWDTRPRDQPCFGTSSLQPFMGREVALAALADVWAQMVTDQVEKMPCCEQISLHNETQQAN